MPARRTCHTKIARWPNGDILVAGNVPSEADFRDILDYAGDPGIAKTANCRHPMLFEVQPANIPGRIKTKEDYVQVAPCTFSLAHIWKDRDHFGDITVEALNGAKERAHRAILADRLPALRDDLLNNRPDMVSIAKATTGKILTVFLSFLYTGEYDGKSIETEDDLRQLLQLAEHHNMTRLMDLIDKDMAQSVRYLAGELSHETGPFSSGGPPVTAPGLLNKLGTADRLGRKRVEEVALYYITASWEDIKGSLKSPVVQLRPETRQRLERLGAHARPMHIWRGQLSIKQVLAKEYADAGGKLSPQEAEALAADLAARKGPGLTAEERRMCENYSVEVADLNEIMDAFPYWTPSWTLLSNTYDCAHEFWEDVFMKSFPHLGKLLKKKGLNPDAPGGEAKVRGLICEALHADHGNSSVDAAKAEEARIMARAEQGDRSAQTMATLDVSIPVPMLGL